MPKIASVSFVDSDALSIDSGPSQPGIRGSDHPFTALSLKGVEARQKQITDGLLLKQDWLDAEHWRALAKKYRYRLPHWYLPLTSAKIEAVLHDLGKDIEFFRKNFRLATYREFVERNPRVPLWAFAGISLEIIETV